MIATLPTVVVPTPPPSPTGFVSFGHVTFAPPKRRNVLLDCVDLMYEESEPEWRYFTRKAARARCVLLQWLGGEFDEGAIRVWVTNEQVERLFAWRAKREQSIS